MKSIHMTLPTRTLAALKALAKDREIPQTELLRRIVDDYLERAISLERAHDRILGHTRDQAIGQAIGQAPGQAPNQAPPNQAPPNQSPPAE